MRRRVWAFIREAPRLPDGGKLHGYPTPVAKLISRHARDLLSAYYEANPIATPIADRENADSTPTGRCKRCRRK